MPITNNGSIEYTTPSHIRTLITSTFSTHFLKELHLIFGVGLEDTDMDYFVYQGGTSGWVTAFDSTCRKLGLHDLCKYYHALPWYDSDAFDCDLADILVEQKLILGGFLHEEIARQNKMSPDDVLCCERCGKYYHEKDIVENEIDLEIEGDDEPYVEYICRYCSGNGKSRELPLDVNRAITEILNKSPSDFFVCEKCGKTHYLAHKGEKYCLRCEQIKEENAGNTNDYYVAELKENEKYRKSLKCDREVDETE